MLPRTFKTYPHPQEENVEEAEGSLDTQSITGKDVMTIASLAYALYEQRGREDGYDLDDWFEAEQRVVSRGQGRGL